MCERVESCNRRAPGWRSLKRSFGLVIPLFLLTAGAPPIEDDLAEKEDQIKAAFIYSFSKFVVWPEKKFPDEKAPIVLGMVGHDYYNMFEMLNWAANKKGFIQGRPLKVVRMEYRSSKKNGREDFLEQLRNCHLVYMGNLSKKKQLDIFEIVENHCVLTIGNNEFTSFGGMVALVRRGDHIAFSISIPTVEKECMVISPKVLRNAEIIGK